MVIHLMTMTHRDIAPRMAADDDAHAAKDSAMVAVEAMETQTQGQAMEEALGEVAEITVATVVEVVEATLEA
jgi:hypothetical protein